MRPKHLNQISYENHPIALPEMNFSSVVYRLDDEYDAVAIDDCGYFVIAANAVNDANCANDVNGASVVGYVDGAYETSNCYGYVDADDANDDLTAHADSSSEFTDTPSKLASPVPSAHVQCPPLFWLLYGSLHFAYSSLSWNSLCKMDNSVSLNWKRIFCISYARFCTLTSTTHFQYNISDTHCLQDLTFF